MTSIEAKRIVAAAIHRGDLLPRDPNKVVKLQRFIRAKTIANRKAKKAKYYIPPIKHQYLGVITDQMINGKE